MADDLIQLHIQACSARTSDETTLLVSRILRECWPGGPDRSEPAALDWLRRWHPGRSEALLPACTCSSGRCRICN